MSYSTNYKLSILNEEMIIVPDCEHENKRGTKFCPECGVSSAPVLLDNRIKKELPEIVGYNPLEDSCKWYEHDEHMRQLSKKYPSVVFILHGEGEEQGDDWFKYYKNGKMQECRAKIIFDEYDERKLS